MRARFYNPVVGRFTQEDVYRGDGLNLYAYCANNPVIYFDTSGYKRECPPSKESNFEEYRNKKKSDQLPKGGERGRWVGEEGNSAYIPSDSKIQEELNNYGIDRINYRNGEVDFGPVALETVKIHNMSGESSKKDARRHNFKSADNELMKVLNEHGSQLTVSDIKKMRQKYKLTWHECNDIRTMQLVPSKINLYFGHTGGIGEINMLFDLLEGKFDN